jgi:hypothetical protein
LQLSRGTFFSPSKKAPLLIFHFLLSGAAASIGLEATVLLAHKGCTYSLCCFPQPYKGRLGQLLAYPLTPGTGLSSIIQTLGSATAFLSRARTHGSTFSLGNAAIMHDPSITLCTKPRQNREYLRDERNVLVFITTLLPLLQKAENASIVVIDSLAYVSVPGIDYEELRREKGEHYGYAEGVHEVMR